MGSNTAFLTPNRFATLPGQVSGIVPPHVLDAYADHAIKTGNVALQASLKQTFDWGRSTYKANAKAPVLDLTGGRRQKGRKNAEQASGAYEQGRKPGVSEIFIYDAEYNSTQPGKPIWREWEAEPTAQDIKNLAGYMRSDISFLALHGIKGIHEGNTEFHATVRYSSMDNAYWDGKQMVFGGSSRRTGGKSFQEFHLDEDVLTHEVEHAITESEAGADMRGKTGLVQITNVITDARTGQKRKVVQLQDPATGKIYGGLDYYGESGALNESYSDVASLFRRCRESGKTIRELGYEDLLLGAACMIGNNDAAGSNGKKSAIRNFDNAPGYDRKDIGKDPQPKFYSKRYKGGGDNGGVHYNSGITNYALVVAGRYLAAANPNEKFSDALESVWLKARRRMHSKETFAEAAADIIAAAKELYPSRPEVAQAVEKAFIDVEVIKKGIDHEGRDGGERGDLSLIRG